MTKFIVITGASKGIGRAAADVLVQQGWSVIGVARSAPQPFPGVFIETDLADPNETQALANDLAARAATDSSSVTRYAARALRLNY
jgi:3-oxoacyl-[acyl-carrier protein] reductase